MEFVYFLIIGGVAGWLAGLIVKGGGQGILLNIVIGVIGALLGGWLLGGLLAITDSGLVNSLLTATAGAIILLLLLNLFKKAT